MELLQRLPTLPSSIMQVGSLVPTLYAPNAVAIDFPEFDVSSTTGSITIDDNGNLGNISIEGTVLDIDSLGFVGAGTITSGNTTDLTLDSGNATITFAADDTTLTATGLTTITSAATLGVSATTLNLGDGSAATIGTISDDNLTIAPNGTGNLILDPTGAGSIQIGSADVVTTTIDSLGFSIDGNGTASNVSLNTDGAGDDLTIALTGNTDSSIILSSAGTGADAIALSTTAGGIDINSNNNVTVDTTSGSIGLSAAGGASGDITLSASDDVIIDAADGSSVFLSDYATCGYLYTGGAGVLTCGGFTPADVTEVYWTVSSDGKAIVEKNTTQDVLIGGVATASSNFAFINNAGGFTCPYTICS